MLRSPISVQRLTPEKPATDNTDRPDSAQFSVISEVSGQGFLVALIESTELVV
jgi:hypothetical protein